MKIMDFVKSLLPSLQKNQITEDLRITLSELEEVVTPSYRFATEYLKTSKLKSDKNKELATQFYRNFDLQGSSKQPSYIGEVNRRIEFIKENVVYLRELVEKDFDELTVSEGMTAKKVVVVRAASALSFISRFSTDLLNYMYVQEAIAVNAELDESLQLSPAALKHVERNIGNFASVLSDFGIPNKDFSKILLSIPEVVISSKTDQALKGMYSDQQLDPFKSSYIQGFTGNPIYHLRMVIAEWQSNRYKANKDKKKTLELRLLHLKLQNEGKDDPKIEQEINYVQSRVDKIERYLKDVEESLEV